MQAHQCWGMFWGGPAEMCFSLACGESGGAGPAWEGLSLGLRARIGWTGEGASTARGEGLVGRAGGRGCGGGRGRALRPWGELRGKRASRGAGRWSQAWEEEVEPHPRW